VPDLSATRPPGIKTAASMLRTLLRDLSLSPGGPIVLGGFSQGAMVASELVFSTDHRIAALAILSGTLVDEATWEQNFSRRRGLPVFVSHGRSDAILPFEVADRFRSKLQRAGLDVTWVPFNGGHEVTEEVVMALNAFLKGLGNFALPTARP
jgi:phospholipase/carboxylesterase